MGQQSLIVDLNKMYNEHEVDGWVNLHSYEINNILHNDGVHYRRILDTVGYFIEGFDGNTLNALIAGFIARRIGRDPEFKKLNLAEADWFEIAEFWIEKYKNE